jgi:hypothetical protein
MVILTLQTVFMARHDGYIAGISGMAAARAATIFLNVIPHNIMACYLYVRKFPAYGYKLGLFSLEMELWAKGVRESQKEPGTDKKPGTRKGCHYTYD